MNRSSKTSPHTFSFAVPAAVNPFLVAETVPPVVTSWEDTVWSQDTAADEADETPRPEAIDVRILWGANVLHFAQLSPPRPFTLGGVGSDYPLPGAEGSERSRPLVRLRGEEAVVLVPARGTAELCVANGEVLSLSVCVERGLARPAHDYVGAFELTLPPSAMATVRSDESSLVFEVSRARAGQTPEAGFWAGADLSGQIYTGLSALVHATMIGALAFFLPAMPGDDAENIDRNEAAAMQPYLTAMAENEPERKEEAAVLEAASEAGGGRGGAAAGPSGAMGNPTSASTAPARFALRGDVVDAKVARARDRAEAAQFGLVGILNTDAAAANVVSAAWGQDVAVGSDAAHALGQVWAPNVGDVFGTGLGLSGPGEGGGGRVEGIGLDGIESTVGHGGGDGPWDGPGRGPGHGPASSFSHGPRGLPGRDSHPPSLRPEPLTSFDGTLPREVVQRVVRQNFGRFRLCYEAGLRTNPGLTGRVSVAFVIARDGSVAISAADSHTEMADANVVACVVRGFQNLSFPAPANGTVKVVYPLLLAPGE